MYQQQKDFRIKITRTLVSTATGYDILTEIRCIDHPYTDLISRSRLENIPGDEMAIHYSKSDGFMDYSEIINVTHRRVQRIFKMQLKTNRR